MEEKDLLFPDQLKQHRIIKDAEDFLKKLQKQKEDLCSKGLPCELTTKLPHDQAFFGPHGHEINCKKPVKMIDKLGKKL